MVFFMNSWSHLFGLLKVRNSAHGRVVALNNIYLKLWIFRDFSSSLQRTRDKQRRNIAAGYHCYSDCARQSIGILEHQTGSDGRTFIWYVAINEVLSLP